MIRSLHIPREYNIWVHFLFATLVGCTMIMVGSFLYWRAGVTHQMVNRIEAHLSIQDVEQKTMLNNQVQILEILKSR